MQNTYHRLGFLLLPVLLAACSQSAPSPAPAPAPASPTGVNLAAINPKINPCQDFYQYACGNWLANNPIPADESSWSSLQKLYEQNLDQLHQILGQASGDAAAKDGVTQQVGDYYTACMDQAAIDAAGLQPLQSELAAIAAIKSKDQLAPEVARLQLEGGDVLFGFGSDQDFKDARAEIAEVSQGGLGLPDRDYYT
ncbi:MAG: M13 family peptidase, partial [Terriglobales bacterium]